MSIFSNLLYDLKSNEILSITLENHNKTYELEIKKVKYEDNKVLVKNFFTMGLDILDGKREKIFYLNELDVLFIGYRVRSYYIHKKRKRRSKK